MGVVILKAEPKSVGEYDLNPRQSLALPLVVSGKSNVAIAAEIGVNVMTVSEWTNHHPEFKRAVKAETDKVLDASRQKIAAASIRAVDKLITTIDTQAPSANVTKAAQLLLDRAGITNPAEVALSASGIDPQVAALANLIHQRRAAEILDKAKNDG